MSAIDSEGECSGCDVELTLDNIGGYRQYCDKCVKTMGAPPKGIGSCMVVGSYSDFKWVRVDDV